MHQIVLQLRAAPICAGHHTSQVQIQTAVPGSCMWHACLTCVSQHSAIPNHTTMNPQKRCSNPTHNQIIAKSKKSALKPGMVECQCRGDIVAVLRMPRRDLVAVDVVVAHASVKPYPTQAAKEAGCTATMGERTKWMRFKTDMPDHAACWVMPCFAVVDVQVDGIAGGTVQNRLGHTAAESGHIPKGAFVRTRECSCCR